MQMSNSKKIATGGKGYTDAVWALPRAAILDFSFSACSTPEPADHHHQRNGRAADNFLTIAPRVIERKARRL